MKTELEKCLGGEPFNGGDPELAAMALNAKRLTKQLNETDPGDRAARMEILKRMLGRIGRNVHIDIDFHCEYGRHTLRPLRRAHTARHGSRRR